MEKSHIKVGHKGGRFWRQ